MPISAWATSFSTTWVCHAGGWSGEIAPYLYAGVTLATPALFAGMAAVSFSMNAVWDRAIAAGTLRAMVHDGLWFHLSRP